MSERSYNLSARNVGLPARIRFADGDEVFEAFFDTEMGLGPDFNANSCTSCHVNNGRQFPVETGTVGIGPVVHVSAPGATVDEAPFDLPASAPACRPSPSTAANPKPGLRWRGRRLRAPTPTARPMSFVARRLGRRSHR